MGCDLASNHTEPWIDLFQVAGLGGKRKGTYHMAGAPQSLHSKTIRAYQRMVAAMISEISPSDAAITSPTIGSIMSAKAAVFMRAMNTLSSAVL